MVADFKTDYVNADTANDRARVAASYGFVHIVDYLKSPECSPAFKNTLKTKGSGSHSFWVHPQMIAHCEALAAQGKQADAPVMPENVRSVDNQKPYEVMECTSPAPGTWKAIQRQMNWCNSACKDAQGATARRALLEEFAATKRQITTRIHNDQRCVTLQRRALCQAFKKGGEKAAKEYLKTIAPELADARTRMDFAAKTLEVLQQRSGDISMRRAPT